MIMKWLNKVTALLLTWMMALLPFVPVSAQEIEMADALRESGQIYVVVAVLLVIFTGIIIFLILLERKMSRMEKRIKI